MMKVRPEYFGWPAERQERYGAAMPEQDGDHLKEVLMAELFGRTFASREEAVAAADVISLAEQDRWNQIVLPLHGIGEDHFYLNEWFAEDKSILDFDTVRAFDEDDYRFQEQVRKAEDPSYVGKSYRGSLYLNWARLFVDDRFTYATLSMAAGYIYAQLSEAGHELLDARIPHRHVPGKHHGKAEGEHLRWDMRVDAGGQEGVLEALQLRVWDYEQARYDALRTEWGSPSRRGVYLLDESRPPEANLHVVFADKEALAAVRFRSFLRDCHALQRSTGELSQAVEEEKTALARFIEAQHADVIRTYDPKLTRLRRKRKVLVAKGAFDNLE